MQRQPHHGHDSRFGGPEGRRFGGEHGAQMQDRADRGRFAGARDEWRNRDEERYDDRDHYYDRTSAYGNDRSGYRSNDNARYGGGYQAGGSSGEGAAYGGRDWYAGGAGDNRPYADIYERGERGYSPDYYDPDRGYDPRNLSARSEREDEEARRYGPAPGYGRDDRRFSGGYYGRPPHGYESSHERRDDHGRFAGRDPNYDRGGSYEDDRRSRSYGDRYMPRRDDGRFRR